MMLAEGQDEEVMDEIEEFLAGDGKVLLQPGRELLLEFGCCRPFPELGKAGEKYQGR